MSGSEAESRQAAQEARRDILGHVGSSGTANRYDALLRYVRGLYGRALKERQVPESPKTDPVEKGETDEKREA